MRLAGNRAAQGGYGGDITIECFGNNEMDITSEIPFMGEDTRRKSLRVIKMGVYVASGSNGCTGKSTGDIAYINKVASKSTSKTEGKYYGFEKDQKIEVELDVIKKPRGDQNLYVKYRDEIKNKKRYTKLSMDSLKDMQVKVVDAVKKKAVIRQSLVRHLDQIDRRNQLIESIQKMLSNPTVHHSNSIGEILNEMENIVHQHHQLTIQRQQQQFDKIDQEQYVKSKIDSSRTFPKPKIIGRRPVYLNPLKARLNEHYIDDVDVYCLDELLTEEGITDSLLHCLFGQLNWEGKFVCRDADKFYKLIAKHGRENESQDSTLGSAELEILAEILEIKIHVYERHGSSSFQYTKTVDPKNIDNNEYFILYEDDGLWKRLSPNNNLNLFCKEFSPADDEQNCNPTYFEQLKHWIDKKDKVITSVENLNPQNKTPDKLSQLLLSRISNLNNDVEQTEKLASAISSLTEWVEYYNTWDFSPLFYLNIVENNEPNDWQFEFLLLELEDQFWKQWEEEEYRENWRKDAREYLNRHERALRLFTQIAMKKEESDFSVSFEFNILLRMMEENIDIEEFFDDDDDIGQLCLINFYYKKTNQFQKQLNDISSTHLPRQTSESRNVGEIIFEMKKKVSKLDEIEQILNESNSKKFEFKEGVDRIVKTLIDKNEKYNKFKIFPKEEKSKPISTDMVKTTTELFLAMMKKANKHKILNDKHICHKIVKFTDGDVCFNYEVTEYFLCVFDYAVEHIMGFKLRDTQRVAITTLLVHGYLGHSKTLAQVSTGEGKSIIVAGLAIGFALFRTKKMKNNRRNNKVDVITSNDVLALRDSNLPVAKGGLKELYEFFNVTVANNSSKSADERIKAYSMDVVYGQLANFQRDYLLDEFYNRGIRGDRPTVYGIIDEVDCMLLDRGNNMLYLSHDIPGMEMLETLYIFIWEKIQHHSVEMVKSHILYDLYGQIKEEDLENIHAPLGREKSERHAIWTHLIEKKVIDRQGRLLINEVSEITKEKIDYVPKNETMKEKTLNTKIVFYFQTIAERERRIRIPSHLLDFVDRHLETWLDNARRALELKQDEDYVIDHDRSDPSTDLNPRVIIIDPDTGTDQSSSQWDGALHQFLQLKEGCKLTLQSLKAVFVSNATYIGKYSNLAGLSGTLGSQPEQKFLEKLYMCDLITVPTAFPKRFSLKPAQIFKTKESWRKAVTEETRLTITDRSILIFCRSIKEVNVVYKHLKSATQDRNDKNKRIHRYTRDYEKFEFENYELDVGNVIVATNLAGRGTDIKISKKLEANGGLHICLTYFPDNERVEEQAMGRAARKGEPGSGILILCEEQIDQAEDSSTSEEWGAEKMFVMIEEREWKERRRISRLEKDFNHTEVLERFFEEYTTDFSVKNVRNKYKEIEYLRENQTVQLPADDVLLNVIHESALDKWSLSLDEADYDFKCFGLQPGPFTIGVDNFYGDILQWITPGRKVPFAKHLAITKTEQIDKKEAADILTELIRSIDHFFYPAAFYYRAFIQLTEMKSENKKFEEEKIEFIRTLRRTETILNEHIDMQNFLCITYQSDRKPGPTPSFCEFNGYKEQKENNIKIFLCFLSSIQWLLGRRCSLSDLREASGETPKAPGCVEKCLKIAKHLTAKEKGGKDKETLKTLKQRRIRLEKVDEYFGKLMESKCIVFELNDPDAIPSDSEHQNLKITSVEKRSKLILQIADDYGVGASLEDKLNLIFDDKSLNEENVEQKLKKKIKIPCSRKAFWNELVKAEALKPLLDCNGTDCVIVSEDQLEEFKLDKAYAIKFNFGGKSFHDGSNHLYVLYNPLYDIKQVLGEGKKLLFSKEYVKDSLLSEYSKRKRRFESNKIAQLNLTKLRDVNLESFGRLAMDDLRRHKIDRFEQKEIWNQLINQKIINGQGYLVPGYDFALGFNYPDCPAYAKAVTQLVEKKFVVEIVRMQWLKSTDNPSCLQAIHLLPRKPHRDMLGDLMAAHVISGARVTEDRDTNLQKEVENLTEYDEERKCMMEFLTSHQPVYTAKPITPDIFLDFIEYFFRENVFSELYVFRLVGFDRIIDIKDRERNFRGIRTDSMWASLIITIGLASMGLGVAALIPQKFVEFKIPSKVCKNLLLIGGFSDISYVVETILSRKDFTWTDYGRQRIRSAKGRVKPINTIEDLLKLSRSSNRSFKDFFSSDEKDIPNSRPK
jgi:preprotein translocase subunit SecA